MEIEILWFVDFTSDDSRIKYREKNFYCMCKFQIRYYKTRKMLWRSSKDPVFSLTLSRNLILTIHVF